MPIQLVIAWESPARPLRACDSATRPYGFDQKVLPYRATSASTSRLRPASARDNKVWSRI
jgi:hypothetical protein